MSSNARLTASEPLVLCELVHGMNNLKKKTEHCFIYVKQQLMNILINKKSLKLSKTVRSRNPKEYRQYNDQNIKDSAKPQSEGVQTI